MALDITSPGEIATVVAQRGELAAGTFRESQEVGDKWLGILEKNPKINE